MRTRKAKQSALSVRTATRQPGAKAQTTLRLPRKLYNRAKVLADNQKTGSMNDFIVTALLSYVRALERKAIDEAFVPMAHDKDYRRETLRIMREFAVSDAETIALSERDLLGS